MAQPTPSDVHVNAPLTNVSIAYMQDQTDFIADKAFPGIPVKKQSDRYYSYDKGNWFRAKAQRRAPGAESAGSGWTVDNTPTYYCDVWALHHDVDDQVRANADSVLDPDIESTEFVTRDIILTKEVQWASNYFAASTWTGSSTNSDITVSPKWLTAGSTPIADMRTECRSIMKNTGFRANKAVMGEYTKDVLLDHPDLLDRIKYTETGIVSTALLASVLGLNEILVGGAVINTANEGAADSLDFLFGDAVLLIHSAPKPGLRTPSAGYSFMWSDLVGGAMRILRFRMEWLKSDRVEGECAFAQKLVAAKLGAYIAAPSA